MKKYVSISVWTAVFVAGTALLAIYGEHTPYFTENFGTFFYEGTYLHDTFFRIGGGAALIAAFITQFFVAPLPVCALLSLVLTLAALEFNRVLSRISGGDFLLPAALLPSVALAVIGYNVNYLFSGTAAFLMVMICADIQTGIRRRSTRFTFSIISAVLLFFLAGPASALYTVLLLITEIFREPRKAWLYILPPAAIYLLSILSLRMGWCGELRHLLTPEGYFTLKLKGGSINWLPWTLAAASAVMAGIFSVLRSRPEWLPATVTALLTAALVWFCGWQAPRYIDRDNEIFKELSYLAGQEDWNGIVQKCSGISMDNLVRQNFLNMALAEKGILADRLFTHPCHDVQSIYVQGARNPYIYTLLSDVYWSMGHVAFSLRYAFEANESLGGYSPRLLKRLVQTNEALGYGEVAAKYRRLLSRTLFYRRWAKEHETPQVKKDCIFPDNRFCGVKGLDDDLRQIVLKNPAHGQTVQYLGSLCLLLRDTGRFMNMMETFYGTEALPEVLPTAFQEGIVYCAAGDAAMLGKYHIQKDVTDRYEAYKADHRDQVRTFWFFINDQR